MKATPEQSDAMERSMQLLEDAVEAAGFGPAIYAFERASIPGGKLALGKNESIDDLDEKCIWAYNFLQDRAVSMAGTYAEYHRLAEIGFGISSITPEQWEELERGDDV